MRDILWRKNKGEVTLEEIRSDDADELANMALKCGLETGEYISSFFLFREIRVSFDKEKVTGCSKSSLETGQ